jgi:hypothetical protein
MNNGVVLHFILLFMIEEKVGEKEAKARIKINKLLEESGWRFFDTPNGKTNILLENNIKLTVASLNELGENFEKTTNGFIDFLLLDAQQYPHRTELGCINFISRAKFF